LIIVTALVVVAACSKEPTAAQQERSLKVEAPALPAPVALPKVDSPNAGPAPASRERVQKTRERHGRTGRAPRGGASDEVPANK